MLEILLAVTLSWTNPTYSQQANWWTQEPDTLCHPGTVPCTDLAAVEFWGHRQWATHDSLLATKPVGGRAGLPDTLTFNLPGIWAVWGVAVDSAGNRSCPSRIIGVNLPLAVPTSPLAASRFEFWFDVAGRRLKAKPTAPGVYLRTTERETSRVVILR